MALLTRGGCYVASYQIPLVGGTKPDSPHFHKKGKDSVTNWFDWLLSVPRMIFHLLFLHKLTPTLKQDLIIIISPIF